MIIEAARIFSAGEWLEPGWIEISEAQIHAVGRGKPPRDPDFRTAMTLVPGFIDAHVHGGGGQSFDDPDPDAAGRIATTHLRRGTTTIMASLVTAPLDQLEQHVRRLAPHVRSGDLAGIHLEGPWLSPSHKGAHAPELLRAPARGDVAHLLQAGAGTVRMVTLAPELAGGLDAVRQICSHGAVAAIGHTDASYEQTRAAIQAGATAGTHVFNGMRPIHHRQPGPATALLEDKDVFVELIADGVHLHPAMIRRIFDSPARAVLVTDAMAAADAPEGRYRLGGLDVDVRDGQARLAGSGSIAGSTLTLDAALRYAVEAAGVPLGEALTALTEHPATMLGLSDVGALEPGKRADLVVLDEGLTVCAVMRAGQWTSPPSFVNDGAGSARAGSAPMPAGPGLPELKEGPSHD
ncbi:N-acetylglucosamine-6-phosphate deacetylase [Arthrobacter oryzae]|uniref:N-acetylglucosamine-6-phosphate deacetylase n=1 Tax=Arthrobacter oryzae TaxID=409290 RepID=A0A3N0C5J5_9MICC|nr:N-acetylglucosamine-6-phosphate deacetylase [Arthrobacter oryzae]RNL58102.1 N-acetylglucosamine-6-phosphate deacetylase [Arthrobacter oryzae]